MIYTTYDLHTKQRQILDEAKLTPIYIRRKGDRYKITYEPLRDPQPTNEIPFDL